MNKKPIQVLLFEDNLSDVRLIREFLSESVLDQFEVMHVERLETGLKHLTQEKSDVILLDLGLPDSQGLETFTKVFAQVPNVPIVVMTGLNDMELALKAVKVGAQDYLVKGEVSDGLLVRAICYAIERKLVGEALYQSNAFNTMLLQTIPSAIDIVNEAGQVLFLNPALEKLLGNKSLGKLCWDLYKDDKQQCKDCPLKFEFSMGVTNTIDSSGVLGGRIFEISHTGIIYQGQKAILEVFHDITDRKQAEMELKAYSDHLGEMVEDRTRELRDTQEKLIRHEKLAVLGLLAGAVSHELRNPLSVINTSIYYLKLTRPETGEKIKQHYAMIEQEVHNAEKIIADLLDFTRVVSAQQEPVSLPELIQRVLARFPATASVEVALEIPDDLTMVFADPLQVEQVLVNLTVNAYQAMKDGGRLTISAHRNKEMVAIAVKDTGVGITSENKKKLFEPLFTTKAKGIGLGLAVSKKLAEANGGRIEVQSEAGKGSTFTLFLLVENR